MRKLLLIIGLLLISGVSLAQDEDLIGYEIALQRIEEAKRTETIILDLRNLGLTELPPEIGQLKSLKILALDHNPLTHLPIEIGSLSDLIDLKLSWIYPNSVSLVFPPAEVIKQGTPAILAYLQKKAQHEEYQQRMTIATGATGFGLLAALVLGLRWRLRRTHRKPKPKR